MLKTAMLLAAGNSTRIAPVAGSLPKPLVLLGGEAILVRNIRWLARQGVSEIWINLHYRGEEIVKAAGDGSALGVRVQYSQEEQILGTAGGVRKLREHWRGPFWVVYGDNLVNFSLPPMEQCHRAGKFAVTIALFSVSQHAFTGVAGGRVLLDAGGRVTRFAEQGEAISPYVNAGVYLINPEVLDLMPAGEFCDFGHDFFPLLLQRDIPVGGHLIDGYCLGVDTPEAWQRANELVNSGKVGSL